MIVNNTLYSDCRYFKFVIPSRKKKKRNLDNPKFVFLENAFDKSCEKIRLLLFPKIVKVFLWLGHSFEH